MQRYREMFRCLADWFACDIACIVVKFHVHSVMFVPIKSNHCAFFCFFSGKSMMMLSCLSQSLNKEVIFIYIISFDHYLKKKCEYNVHFSMSSW